MKKCLVLGAVLLLQACATGPDANPKDPLEPLNRAVYRFNDALDEAVLKPTAKAYQDALPSPIRTGVGNFFANLSDVWSFINAVLQFKLQEAGDNLMRVGVNTLFGLGGLLDVATELNIERHKEDFGQTLRHWAVGAGPYVVLPFFGPSTLRDTVALAADTQGDAVLHVTPVPERNALYLLRVVDTRADLLALGDMLDEVALDRYSFTRDAYLQHRRHQVNDGKAEDLGEPQEEVPASPAQPPGAQSQDNAVSVVLAAIYAE